jgi:hypothetical protein
MKKQNFGLWTSGVRSLTLISVISIVLFIGFLYGQVTLQNSDKVKAAKKYAESNKEIAKEVGHINGYGFWFSHQVDRQERNSYVSFHAKGTVDTKKIKIYFVKDNEQKWNIVRHEFL